MHRNIFTKILSAFMAALMVFSIIPISVGAETTTGNTDSSDAETESSKDGLPPDFMKIMFLDCGRKYFTKDWIIALINEAAADGYTHVSLALGNNGLRFLLDDMSIGDYTNEQVTNGIKNGNIVYGQSKEHYQEGCTNELTEADMDEIISTANAKNIGIIPLINTPGHMDAILSCMIELDIKKENTTYFNVTNPEEVKFAEALIEKYLRYFKNKGIEYFNIGADEYKNTTGFQDLINTNQYHCFANYVNDLCGLIKTNGMKPMAFNDGIYYKNKDSELIEQKEENIIFDKDLIICYWSSGYQTYSPASAHFLEEKGHKLINSSENIYYVVGGNNHFDNGNLDAANNFYNNKFSLSGSEITNTTGSMFCAWFDSPWSKNEKSIANELRMPMRAVICAMNNEHSKIKDLKETRVEKGFNQDGTIGNTIEKDKIKVFAPGQTLTSLYVTEVKENLPEIKEAEKIFCWDIKTKSGEKELTDIASITLPRDEFWKYKDSIKIFTVTDNVIKYFGENEVISDDYTYTVKAPASCRIGIAYSGPEFSSEGIDEKDIDLGIGQYEYRYINSRERLSTNNQWINGDGIQYKIESQEVTIDGQFPICGNQLDKIPLDPKTDSNKHFYCVLRLGQNKAIALNKKTKNVEIIELYEGEEIPENAIWDIMTIRPSSQYYSIGLKIDGTKYFLGFYDKDIQYTYNEKTHIYDIKIPPKVDLNKDAINSKWIIQNKHLYNYNKRVYMNYNSMSKQLYLSNYNDNSASIYDIAQTTTSITYWTNKVTFKKIATKGTTVTIIPNNNPDNEYKYTFKDSTNDPNFEIDTWITNRHVTIWKDNNNPDITPTIHLKDHIKDHPEIASENGVPANELVPLNGTFGTDDKNIAAFWQLRLLPYNHQQDDSNGDDETRNGERMYNIRYWKTNGTYKWEYSNKDGTVWKSLKPGYSNKKVAYYVQPTEVTDEIKTYVVDWGIPKNKLEAGKGDAKHTKEAFGKKEYTFLDYAVVYEDGTQRPDSFPQDEKTLFYNNDDKIRYNNKREIGSNFFLESKEYKIWKVTVTEGIATKDDSVKSFACQYDNSTEKEVWRSGKDPEPPKIEGLKFQNGNQTGKLIRVYIKANEDLDNLKVHYIDATSDQEKEFYQYGIVPTEGALFDKGFKFNREYTNIDLALSGNKVTNSQGIEQTVTANLSLMEEVPPEYRNTKYQCINATLKQDRKEIFIYYNFAPENTYHTVLDFGLETQITSKEINSLLNKPDSITITENGTYGTASLSQEPNEVNNKNNQDNIEHIITYKPNNTTTLKHTDKITFKITENNDDYIHTIYIHPASNVLYEEDFLHSAEVTEENKNDVQWNTTNQNPETRQQSVLNKANYGFDVAYNNSTGISNNSYIANGLSAEKYTTQELNTEIYGNGFDLIGTSSPTSGMLFISITNETRDFSKGVFVDTSHSSETFYQVPLAHIVMPKEDDYTVSIFGGYRTAPENAPKLMSYGIMDCQDFMSEMYKIIEENDIEDIEFVKTSVPSPMMFYTATNNNTPNISKQQGTYVEIDGFRVYRNTAAGVYVPEEQNTIYKNIIDSVEKDKSIVAYIDGTSDELTIENYEASGGPQNEVYLSTNQSISIAFTGKTPVQISLRAVKGETTFKLNDANGTDINHATELYYTVTPGKNGIVTIMNTGENLLAVCNVKFKDNIHVRTLNEDDLPVIFSMMSSNSSEDNSEDNSEEDPGESIISVLFRFFDLIKRFVMKVIEFFTRIFNY